MQLRKIIEQTIRRSSEGSNLEADVHAAVAANLGEPGSVTATSSTRQTTVVQGKGGPMPDHEEVREPAELTEEELERQRAEALPNREAMSVISPDIGRMPPISVDPDSTTAA